MVRPDPTLGIVASFPTEQVRNAFLYAMQLGKPNEASRQVRFLRRTGAITYYRGNTPVPITQVRRDRDGKPLDPTVRVVRTADEEVAVDCAIELTEANAEELPVGNFRPVKATVTLMTQEYDLIKGSREMLYNNDRYGFGYELEATGLFDLTVHTLIFFALNES